jgi:outer membrane immunogenic protein
MKILATAAIVAAAALSAPAAAQDFSGARIGANIGFADEDAFGTEALVYGVNVGYDFDLGGAVAGVSAEYADSDEDGIGRDLSVSGRIGGKVGTSAMIYAMGGYTNLSVDLPGDDFELDGARIGGGVEFALTPNVFANGEYRYSNYELGFETHQMLVGAGFRF